MKPLIILENIRSVYNVGNIIRTADALGYDVILSGFTAHPDNKEQVKKSSLGAEESVNILQFRNPVEAMEYIKKEGYFLIAGEGGEKSVALDLFDTGLIKDRYVAIVVGNENTGVLPGTLAVADAIIEIPMRGVKESLNVGQAAAILMWEVEK